MKKVIVLSNFETFYLLNLSNKKLQYARFNILSLDKDDLDILHLDS